MAARGSIAKETATKKILEAFGDKAFVADKKIYAWVSENGEQVQVCIALTCPKTPVGEIANDSAWDVSATETPVVRPEVSAEDQEKIDKLCKMLDLI